MKDAGQILSRIESTGIVAIVRADDSEQLGRVIAALCEGGVTCIEVTMTTPNALQVIHEAAVRHGNTIAIGVGSVLDAETARSAILAGAEYIVAPIVDLPTIRMARRYGRPVIPGAFTPTEIVRAWEAGADLVKVFPATKLGPQFLKDVAGPLPHIRLVPTGGVTTENVGDFLRAGATAVGVGGALVSKTILASRDYPALTNKAAALLDAVQAARA